MLQALMERMNFSEKVKALLESHRMSQAQLAEVVGTHQPQVSKWLNSGVVPSIPLALRVARALKVPLDYLVDDAQDDLRLPSELGDDERAIIDLYRDLELSRQEAVKRLATPLERFPKNLVAHDEAGEEPPAKGKRKA